MAYPRVPPAYVSCVCRMFGQEQFNTDQLSGKFEEMFETIKQVSASSGYIPTTKKEIYKYYKVRNLGSGERPVSRPRLYHVRVRLYR